MAAKRIVLKKYRAGFHILLLLSMIPVSVSCSFYTLRYGNLTDAEKIEFIIQRDLNGKVMGYAYVVLHHGEIAAIGSGGLARNSLHGQRPFQVDDRVHIASISKFITTVATARILRDYGLNLNSPFYEFLPADWEKGENIENIRFIDLLSHRTGFVKAGEQGGEATHTDSLKNIIASGAVPDSTRVYRNTNHALMRIIIPELLNRNSGITGTDDYGVIFLDYLRNEIFPLAGDLSPDIDMRHTQAEPVLAYQGSSDQLFGYGENANFLDLSGGFGLHMSVVETVRFWSAVWNSDAIINHEERELIKETTAGLFNSFTGKRGPYFIKQGIWVYHISPYGTRNRIDTVAGHFPDGWDIVIFMNSPHDDGKEITHIMVSAYERVFR